MDPLPTDPNVLFIHPPFNTFPNAHLYSDGLTYNLMAENPEWFLDPKDFVSQGNTNHNAIAYPPYLEPPRGWCPAKKKDLKERGGEGWPEGEEPACAAPFAEGTMLASMQRACGADMFLKSIKLPCQTGVMETRNALVVVVQGVSNFL
jgi:hypothetical protein